jgi:adenylate kinase family enzyme
LVSRKEDGAAAVKKRYQIWNQNVSLLEDNFKNVLLATSSDKSIETVVENIHNAVENPIF